MIEIRDLTKRYESFTAVDSVSLSVPDGQLTVLLGPSGSGKTTMLRMINRMVEPSSGSITVDGVETSSMKAEDLRRSMGYVIQNTGLFPNMTIRRNVATVPRLLGWERARIDARVDEMLDLMGLDPSVYGGKYPSQLSGGEAQRVGVARALAADPPVLLMDEPFGAVDPLTRERLQIELKRLHSQLGTTILFVTHDIDEAVLLADRIALLHEGRLEQYAAPEEMWLRPATDFVRGFFGENLGLRIMARHRLSTVALEPLGPGDEQQGLPRIDASATLKEALAELVGAQADRLVVYRDGTAAGVVRFDGLLAALGDGGGAAGRTGAVDDGSDDRGTREAHDA